MGFIPRRSGPPPRLHRHCAHAARVRTLRELPLGPAWLCSQCTLEWDEEGGWPVTHESMPVYSDEQFAREFPDEWAAVASRRGATS